MPEKLHYNVETEKLENYNSDYLVCSVCGHDQFIERINPQHLAGEEDTDLIKICENCGNQVKLYKEENERKKDLISFEEYQERKKQKKIS